MNSAVNCHEIEPLIDAYRDGELSGADKALVDGHLQGCPVCQARLADIERLVTCLKALPRLEAPRDIAAEIDKVGVRGSNVRPLFWTALGVAAAALLIVVTVKVLPAFRTVVASAPQAGAQRPWPYGKRQPPQMREGEPVGRQTSAVIASAPAQNASPGPTTGRPHPEKPEKPDKPVGTAPDAKTPKTAPAPAPPYLPAASTPPLVALAPASQVPLQEESVAVAVLCDGGQNSITEVLGIETDEDGLYAIKM